MKFISFFFFNLLISAFVLGQSRYSGNVIDAWDKKYLEGVEVSVAGKHKVKTNARGYFSVPAFLGDTLLFHFPGFFDKKWVVGEDRFFLLELQDQARLLPTFQVKAEPYRFQFRDGKLYLVENEEFKEKSLSQEITVPRFNSPFSPPGLTVYGPISYFTKRNRQLRQYEERLEWLKRRQGYLEVIDSDSIRTALMDRYGLDRRGWDDRVIRFNQFHQAHDFLDWKKERVLEALNEFFRIENFLGD
jgi:hypothetical protein